MEYPSPNRAGGNTALAETSCWWLPWAGAAACVAGAGVAAAGAALGFSANLSETGFTRGEALELVHVVIQVPVLVALIDLARRIGSTTLQASNACVYVALWLLTVMSLLESERRPQIWEVILVVASGGFFVATLVETFKLLRAGRAAAVAAAATEWAPPASSAPAETSLPSEVSPPVLDYARPAPRSSDWMIAAGVLLVYMIFKGAVMRWDAVWVVAVAGLFLLLMLMLAGSAIWSGTVKFRLRRRLGVAAAVSGAFDFLMIALSAGVIAYAIWLGVSGAVTEEGALDAAMRVPLLILGGASVAWELAVGALLLAGRGMAASAPPPTR